MANPQLSVEITAKIDGLRDAFNKAIRETNNLDKNTKASLSKIDRNFAELANDIDKSMGRASKSISTASNSVSKSLAQAAVAGSKSKNTYLELGRVLQDLPFGFTGIQNNLTQLIPASGALGLAFSGIISALTFLQVGTDYWGKSLKGAKNNIDDVKKSGDDYLETLNQVVQAQLIGNQNTTKEITELKVLYSAYQNANLPLKARQTAYKQLQSSYPAYFGNLKFEKEASDKTRAAYDELTQSILASGRARAAVDLIAKNETRKLEQEQKLIDLQKQQLKNQKELDLAAKRRNPDNASLTTVGVSTNTTSEFAFAKAQIVVNNNIKARRDLVTDINKLNENSQQLLKSINVDLTKGAILTGNIGAAEKKLAEQRKIRSISALPIKTGTGTELQGLGAISVTENLTQPKGLSAYVKLMQEASFSTDRFNESIRSLGNTAIGSGLAEAFSQIGVALADGTSAIDAFGNALLSAFANFLGQLGQMFIKEGIAQIGYGIAKNLILPGSGSGNIAGGAGMIAAGAGISVLGGALSTANKGKKGKSNSKREIPGFANGVNNFGGGLALVGERGPELVNLPKGSDVIPNNRSMGMMRRGGDTITLNGEFRASGRDLLMVIDDQVSVRKRLR